MQLLLGPQSEAEWDQEAADKSEKSRRERVLKAHEMQHSSALARSEQPEKAQKAGFAARLSARVLDRLQVDITNVTIRYVDSSHGPCSYSITLAVQSIGAALGRAAAGGRGVPQRPPAQPARPRTAARGRYPFER